MATGSPLRITDTVLRDAHQSLLATRMRTEDMLPVAEKLDQVGYWSLEMWGGATFDTCLRFLNEDPWERLRRLRKAMPNTQMQMLLRGQNIVGYRHYPDDVVEKFVSKAAQNGIDVFRVFDAVNDIRNLEKAMKAAKKAGAKVEGALSYTISPVHDVNLFVNFAKKLMELDADTICIKDMAGLLSPGEARALIEGLKREIDLPIHLHTHCTSGMAVGTCWEAIGAGVDIIDTAISSMSLATSQPPTETIVYMAKGTPRDTGLDLALLNEIADYFAEIRKKYSKFESTLPGVDTNVLVYQIPGGMTTNLVNQLREQNALGKLGEVLKEVPIVRRELGYPPLVTPTSQIVGTQAVLNVVVGERYKVIPNEVKQYVKGYYGAPPSPIDEEVKKKVIGNEDPITCRPADLLKPEFEKARKELGAKARSEEDILSFVLFPQVALGFFEMRELKDNGLNSSDNALAAVAATIADRLTNNRNPVSGLEPKLARKSSTGISPWALAGRQDLIRSRTTL
ncbi:MAG: pyruvate/oxaloacetate carboxyltransferase [Promethearchaeati archaeon SRVP18_Atabeyarchaeia-1]